MFWWAASDLRIGQSQRFEIEALLERLRPSLAYLGDVRRPSGAAALVDVQRRLFLANTDAVQGDTVQAKVGDWRVSLRRLGDDERTGLAILALRGDAPPNLGPALAIADAELPSGTKVCVLLADGGMMGTVSGGVRLQISPDRKMVIPVSEIHFETPQQLVGGSLVVSFDGRLVGALGATVARPDRTTAVTLKALGDIRRSLAPPQHFDPGRLVVGYSPSLTLFRRSVGSLISDGHRADYSALGVQVGDIPGATGGTIVRHVFPDSPAAHAGLREGDILLQMGDRSINRQIDFVQALVAFRPGERIPVRIRRDGVESTFEVVLAKSRS